MFKEKFVQNLKDGYFKEYHYSSESQVDNSLVIKLYTDTDGTLMWHKDILKVWIGSVIKDYLVGLDLKVKDITDDIFKKFKPQVLELEEKYSNFIRVFDVFYSDAASESRSVIKRVKKLDSTDHFSEHYLINLYTLVCRVEGTESGIDLLEYQVETLNEIVCDVVSAVYKDLGFTFSKYLKGELKCNVNQFRKILNLDLSSVHSSFELVDNYIKRIKALSTEEILNLAGKYFKLSTLPGDLDFSVGNYLNASVDGFDSLLYFDMVFENEQGTRWAIQFVPSTKDDYDTYRNIYIANQVSSDTVQELVLIYPDKNIIKQYVKADKSKFEYYSSKIVSGESAFRTLPNVRFKIVNDLNAMAL